MCFYCSSPDIMFVIILDESRDTEVEIVSDNNLEIKLSVPKDINLLKSVEVSRWCYSVCSYKGKVYAGCDGGIDMIDENNKITKSFIKVDNNVNSVKVYNDKLYLLVYTGGKPSFKVSIYNLSGGFIKSWVHKGEDYGRSYSRHAVVSNQVIIPDRTNKRLTIYSLDGDIIKYIPLAISDSDTSICSLGTDSVIVTDWKSSKVFRVNISTSELLWTSTAVTKPESVTCYGEDYLIVGSSKKLSLLDAGTGE